MLRKIPLTAPDHNIVNTFTHIASLPAHFCLLGLYGLYGLYGLLARLPDLVYPSCEVKPDHAQLVVARLIEEGSSA